MLRTLDRLKIIELYDLTSDNGLIALIFENFGDCSLKQLIQSISISLQRFLQLAIALVDSLDELHQISIIHRNLHPDIVAIDSKTNRLQPIDYSFASRLSDKSPNFDLLKATLAYISPEQTGRIDRTVDYRSDLYALGVIFYEMLTGVIPFTASEPNELIECHLVQKPIPPNTLSKKIPELVSAIVMKLLAKEADNRYQSATELKLDLQRCLFQFTGVGAIDSCDSEAIAPIKQSLVSQITSLPNHENLLERVRVCMPDIQAALAQKQPQKTLELGLKALAAIGVNLEREPPPKFDFDRAANLPEITEPELLVVLQLLYEVATAASKANPSLMPQVTFSALDFCLCYGNSTLAASVYADYACYLYESQQDFDLGDRFAQLSLQIFTQLKYRPNRSIISNLLKALIVHWREHLRLTIEPLEKALQTKLDREKLLFSERTVFAYCTNLFFLGEPLVNLTDNYSRCWQTLKKLDLEEGFIYIQISQQLVFSLIDNNNDFKKLEITALDKKSSSPLVSFYFYLSQAIIYYLFKRPDLSLANANQAKRFKKETFGSLLVVIHNFYHSLALLARYELVDREQQDRYLKQLDCNQKNMKKWAKHCPKNFQHKYNLIEAEKAKALQNNWQAVELYDSAIQGAKEQKYIQEEALANELAAEFYLTRNKEKIAKSYMIDAYYGYLQWGAIAKVKELEEKYPQLLASLLINSISEREQDSNNLHSKVDLKYLDLLSVIKTSKIISQQIILDELLEQFIKSLLEASGANKGFIILNKKNKLVIETAASKFQEKIVITRQAIPIELTKQLSRSAIECAVTTKEPVIISCSDRLSNFVRELPDRLEIDSSILCLPISKQKKMLGVIYLERDREIFTDECIEIIKLLCEQGAISLENAQLYQNLQQSKIIKKAAQQNRNSCSPKKY